VLQFDQLDQAAIFFDGCFVLVTINKEAPGNPGASSYQTF